MSAAAEATVAPAIPAVEVTPEVLRASADRMVQFYLRDQLPTGQIKGLDDPSHYCKLPNALVSACVCV